MLALLRIPPDLAGMFSDGGKVIKAPYNIGSLAIPTHRGLQFVVQITGATLEGRHPCRQRVIHVVTRIRLNLDPRDLAIRVAVQHLHDRLHFDFATGSTTRTDTRLSNTLREKYLVNKYYLLISFTIKTTSKH